MMCSTIIEILNQFVMGHEKIHGIEHLLKTLNI